jgi:hypothetical protein
MQSGSGAEEEGDGPELLAVVERRCQARSSQSSCMRWGPKADLT